MCFRCLTPVAPIGCDCSRKDNYADVRDGANSWLAEQFDCSTVTGKEAAGYAFATVRRGGRRAGITADEAQADRLDAIEQFEVEPRWTQFRRQEMNHLPV